MRQARKALPAEGAGPADGAPLAAAGRAAADGLLELSVRGLGALESQLQRRVDERRQLMGLQLGMAAFGLLAAAYLFGSFYRALRRDMDALTSHLAAMAQGDLRPVPEPQGRDESADMLRELGRMQAALCELIGDVRGCSGEMAHLSSQVSGGAADLSRQTEQAAGRMQESTAAMESIAGRCRETAAEVQDCARTGRTAGELAALGQQRIQALVTRIDRLSVASQKVGDIVNVIDSIAFQTNILALNAAVEAARAGEQGRGFAVVATEVRALAQRSAGAAREIKQLVSDSCEQSRLGVTAVHEAGESITKLAAEVLAIGTRLESVARANDAQAATVAELASGMSQLDERTQHNAALVTQSSATAQSMREKADQLMSAAGRFQL
ncbi:MAG: methyl-accepting chemotaxis protein [Rubrivivax sp.]|nr:methyl-accepting chemotaxis protein [Rubrivivax sp.]